MVKLADKVRTCGMIPDNPAGYVRWSARNSYLNRKRKLNRGVIVENISDLTANSGGYPEQVSSFYIALTAFDEVDAVDLRIDLEDAIGSLPEITANVTRMRIVERHEFEEIATILGIVRSTVFRHWKLGRERLAKVFGEYGFDIHGLEGEL